jgi:hypothetical protein
MRFWLPVSFAISWQAASLLRSMQPGVSAKSREFSARSYCARFSRLGRSLATAISMPNTVEMNARSERPAITRARRSFFSFGLGGGGAAGGCAGTPFVR